MAALCTHLQADNAPKQTVSTKHITVESGLLSNRSPSIFKDDHGFLWIATYNGLSRYNGESFEHFQKSLDPNSNSINGTQVNAILVKTSPAWDQNHPPEYKAWVGFNDGKGLQVIQNGSVVKTLLSGKTVNLNGLYNIDDNKIAVASRNEVYLFDENFNELNKLTFKDNITAIMPLRGSGGLLLGTRSGIRFSKSQPKGLSALNHVAVKTFHRVNDKIYIGTSDGLKVYDEQSQALTPILTDDTVYSFKMTEETFLLGTQNGLLECDKNLLNFNQCKRYFANNYILSIAHDNASGISWAATRDNGVFQLAPNRLNIQNFKGKPGTHYHSITSLNGKKWIASDGDGLWENDNGRLTQVSGLPSKNILSMIPDNYGRLWLGHFKGLTVFNPGSNKITNLLPNEVVLSLKTDGQNIYVGTDSHGVFIFDLNLKQRKTINSDRGLKSQTITSLEVANSNELWIGTTDGLFNVTANREVTQFLPEHVIWSLKQVDDALYVGTQSKGIFILKNGSVYKNFTTFNSNLLSDTITDIEHLVDSGKIIFSTLNGISYLETSASDWFKNFDRKRGLFPSEFLRNSLSLSEDVLFSGGTNGWSEINNFDFSAEPVSLPLYTKTEVPSEIDYGTPVSLKVFGVNHLSQFPSNISYSLNNNPMVNLNSEDSIHFAQLPSGKHLIRIMFHSKSGVGKREFSINIVSPEKPSFYLYMTLFFFSAFGLFSFAVWYYHRNKLEKVISKYEGAQAELNHILGHDE